MMVKKRQIIENYQEKIGEKYFELLQFASIVQLISDECRFSKEIEDSVDSLLEQIKFECNLILEEEVQP